MGTEEVISIEPAIDNFQLFDRWLVAYGEALGIDVGRARIGNVISGIDDDGNCYHWDMDGARYSSELAVKYKNILLSRIKWKIDVPGLPEEIKGLMDGHRKLVEGSDFGVRDEFKNCTALWENMRGTVRQITREDSELNEAEGYYRSIFNEFGQNWNNYREMAQTSK